MLNTIVRGGDRLLKNNIISVSCDDENEDVLHFATQVKNNIVMVQVDIITGTITELARYSGFTAKYAFLTGDKTSIYLIYQDKKTKIHQLYCTRYQYEDEDEEEEEKDSEESDDGIVRVERSDIEPLGELGTIINFVKIVGNRLVTITTDDQFKSSLTVFNNQENLFNMKQEILIKKGKKVKPYVRQEFHTFSDSTGAIAECFDISLIGRDQLYGLKNMGEDTIDILRLFDQEANIKDNTFTIKEIQ